LVLPDGTKAPAFQGVIFFPKQLLRNVDEDVFEAAAAIGRPALVRVALGAVRPAASDLFAAEREADSERSLVTRAEIRECEGILALADSSRDAAGSVREAATAMERLAAAVERNRALVDGIRLTGPDFGYTTRCLVACYLLADLLATDDPTIQREDARDVVAHSEGYFIELLTPHGRNVRVCAVDDETVAKAEATVLDSVRSIVYPWVFSG
jgi:hypothetical protein